ncbi:MAG: DUF2062 domain-containing protein [Pseudomonadota bacterium]|nr:DUF2062 domain-containing protein [Pseudomonadota bacterium]
MKKGKKPDIRSMIRMLLGSTDNPATIARGVGVGLFVAFSPLLGLHTFLAISLAFLLRGNRLASLLASWICNPLTMIPILYFDFKVGEILLSSSIPFPEGIHTLKDIIHAGSQVAWPLLVGGHLIGLVLGLASIPIINFLVVYLRRNQDLTDSQGD